MKYLLTSFPPATLIMNSLPLLHRKKIFLHCSICKGLTPLKKRGLTYSGINSAVSGRKPIILFILSLLFISTTTNAAMDHAGMIMDETGMIMNANKDNLPRDCKQIAEDVHFTVHAGRKYAEKFNGKMFTYDQQEWNVKPCSRVNFTFINDDHIRHQLMIHGLPGYLYPKGMFTIEINGNGKKEATLIMPSRQKTYLVHCDIAQHTEKGMKGQLKVAGGDQDLPSIPGLTPAVTPDYYSVDWTKFTWLLLVLSCLAGFSIPFYVLRNKGPGKD